MGLSHSNNLSDEETNEIVHDTGFTVGQVGQLYYRFCELDTRKVGKLNRHDFHSIKQLQVNPLGDRISEAFFRLANDDEIDFRTFANILSIFRTSPASRSKKSRGNRLRALKMDFAFRIYDADNDGTINHSDMCDLLYRMIGRTTSAQQIEQMADRIIMEILKDHIDKEITLEEYSAALEGVDIDEKMSIPFLRRIKK